MCKTRVIKIILFLLLACFLSYAGEVRTVEYDFGTVSRNKIVRHEFKFKEEIKTMAVLCDCVKATLLKKKKWLKPSFWTVNVELDPREYSGSVEQEIILIDKNDERITLKLKAFVE